ncbi:MAG: hypothetical protein M1479_10850 [Actinobacteria bacterium]|nr:hypothetical protein [Cyanobacteriota bacterium]MCL5772747.1 hypothetical protein [Actinomycetota bacterium]
MAKLPSILGKRLIKRVFRNKLRPQKAIKMWSMVFPTAIDKKREFLPIKYIDNLLNKYEKYGKKTNRVVMGINDKGIGKGWESLMSNSGNPRGRFFFNYADLVLNNPYKDSNYKYYFQLQYCKYDKRNDIMFIYINDHSFDLKLEEGMHTAILELSKNLLSGYKEISVIFSFNKESLKEKKTQLTRKQIILKDNVKKMDSSDFKKFVHDFRDLFIIEAAVLSEDSQYLRKELAQLGK